MEAKLALAFVARRQGESAMEASRWAHVMSLELGWMPPGAAKQYVAACLEAGLLAGEPAALTFDAKAVEIPKGFRPDPESLPKPAGPLVGVRAWVEAIAERTGRENGDVLEDMHALQQSMGGLLDAEAAILALAKDVGLDPTSAASDVLNSLKTG